MNVFPDTAEGVSTLFQILTIVLIAGTVVTGFSALYFSNKANAEQKEANRQQAERIAGLEKAKAEAELALAEIRKRQEPRRLDATTFISTLKEITTAKRSEYGPSVLLVDVMYQSDDPEAYDFAVSIQRALLASGWQPLEEPDPLKPGIGQEDPTTFRLPSIVSLGGGAGVTITSRSGNVDDWQLRALESAFTASGVKTRLSKIPNKHLSVGIIVGPKP